MAPPRGSRASVSPAARPPAARARLWLARGAWRRWPLALAALFVALLALDALLYQVRLPVAISDDGATLTVAVAGAAPQRMALGARIVAVGVPPRDPLVHEYQLDGTDSTNNFTLDTTYLTSIANTPYYHFYAWMRDLDGLSRWRDLCAGATCLAEPPLSGARLTVPDSAGVQRISAEVQRPETPLALALTMSDSSVVTVTIDRNDHFVNVTRSAPGQPDAVMQTFFPTDAPPFAAMTADFLTRLALWALALLGLIYGGEWLVGLALGALGVPMSAAPASADEKDIEEDAANAEGAANAVAGASVRPPRDASAAPAVVRAYLWARQAATTGRRELFRRLTRDLTEAIHPIGLLALLASFLFTIWIALAQYHALPHIYDATAYLFGARIFATGRIFAPIPPALDRFPGPFMLAYDGKWFPQYGPGAPLALAVGVRLGVPWLVEPLLGTLALLGIGLIARRFYHRRVATLAVLLGALSPFYSYLAASYLSHTVALFYLVWGWWALLRALDALRSEAGRRWYLPWLLPLAGLLWAMALLTRETSAIFIAVVTAGALWLLWLGRADRGARALWRDLRAVDWRRWLAPALLLVGIAVLGVDAYLGYNKLLTGSPTITPRQLFFPGDHYGFGQGVGFYGRHTLASGFINIDELLTSLAINLYGWPFYLTLAFLLIPFLARRARAADLLLLVGATAMTFVFIGFYYHGIYLGPRYLCEALPFFLILTARGLLTLAEVGAAARELGQKSGAQLMSAPSLSPALSLPRWVGNVSLTGAVTMALLACLFGYFLPRQITLHTDFTGMAAGRVIQMSALENPPVHHALVVTSDAQLYGYTLFAMNDPLLRDDVIYAEASGYDQYLELRRAFPDRQLYLLIIQPDGKVSFTPFDVKAAP